MFPKNKNKKITLPLKITTEIKPTREDIFIINVHLNRVIWELSSLT